MLVYQMVPSVQVWRLNCPGGYDPVFVGQTLLSTTQSVQNNEYAFVANVAKQKI